MKLILKLLLLPFKAIDEGLEILLFKVIFHRRLWFITVPLTAGLCWFGWQSWTAYRAAHAPAPVPSASARPAPSPRASVIPPAPPSVKPSAAPSVRPAASPKPSPRPSPVASASPRPAASPAASPRPSPSPSVAAPAGHPLLIEARRLLAAQPAGTLTTDAVDLALALSTRGPRLVRSDLDGLDLEETGGAGASGSDALLLERVLAGHAKVASELSQPLLPAHLTALPAPDAGRALATVLQHGRREHKLALLDALAQSERPLPPEVGNPIAVLLSTRDRALVEAAARAAARLTDRTLAPVLEAVAGKVGPDDRVAVARALAAMRSARAKDELTAGLASRTGTVRAHAFHGLAELGDAETSPAAVEASADPDFVVRQGAARALAEVSEKRGYEVLAADLASPLDVVRAGALATIAQLSERAQIATVTHLIGDKHLPAPARLAALRLLAASPARAATPTLQPLLGAAKPVVRLAVAEELHPEQAKMLRPVLVKQLEKEDTPAVKLALARALAGHPPAADVLMALAAQAPALRPAVARALARHAPGRLPAFVKTLTPPERTTPWGVAARLRAEP